MKVCLVTGAAGFSAKYLIDELKNDKEDWFIYMTDIKYPEKMDTELDPFSFHLCDITKPEEVKEMFVKLVGVDVVFHVASIIDYSASAESLYKVNIEGTQNLINACE